MHIVSSTPVLYFKAVCCRLLCLSFVFYVMKLRPIFKKKKKINFAPLKNPGINLWNSHS